MSLKNDAEKYVKALCGPPNAWGQHIVHDMQSHAFLYKMFKQYGKAKVMDFLEDNYWSKKKC